MEITKIKILIMLNDIFRRQYPTFTYGMIADRIERWLVKPNKNFSGERPSDLIKRGTTQFLESYLEYVLQVKQSIWFVNLE